MDIVRSKGHREGAASSHDKLSTFGLGRTTPRRNCAACCANCWPPAPWACTGESGERHSFDTLCLAAGSRAVLRGEQPVQLREATAHAAPKRTRRTATPSAAAASLGQDAQVRFINLKAWRAEVAREHNLPAYVIFHDATLAAIAERCPATLGFAGHQRHGGEETGGVWGGCAAGVWHHGLKPPVRSAWQRSR